MTSAAIALPQAITSVVASLGTPFFQSDAEPEVSSRWGELFQVFEASLDAVADRMEAAIPGIDDMIDGITAASRRYAAMIEGMCMQIKPGSPCLNYELADGFSVLLMPTGPVSERDIAAVQATYEREAPEAAMVGYEQAFTLLLSGALMDFFAKNVGPGQVVTVSVGGCDYMFVRSAERDGALRDLRIGTSACLF